LPANQAFGRVHGHGAHRGFAEVLGHFKDKALAVVLRFQRVENRRQVVSELHVNDRADDLFDMSNVIRHYSLFSILWHDVLPSSRHPASARYIAIIV
jgi:hypothetical protein